MENRVLAAVDGSAESRDAARWALTEASTRRWPIWFVHVHPPPQVADPRVEDTYSHAAWRAAEPVFAELKAAAQDVGVPAHCKVLFGWTREVLVRLSATAGLGVVGHRYRAGFPSRLGSVASALAAQARCPTVVIPGRGAHPGPVYDRPAADLSRFAGHVVAAVEPGPAAAAVLSAAADMAGRHNLPLDAVTVGPAADGPVVIPDLLAELQAEHQGLRSSSHTLVGRPVHEITEAARDSWLLVVGTRGIGGLTGLVRGSVSQALLQHVSSPVLVVPEARANEPR